MILRKRNLKIDLPPDLEGVSLNDYDVESVEAGFNDNDDNNDDIDIGDITRFCHIGSFLMLILLVIVMIILSWIRIHS